MARIPSVVEVRNAVDKVNVDKALGPDGFTHLYEISLTCRQALSIDVGRC